MSAGPDGPGSDAAGEDLRERVYPESKRRHQDTQLMNALLRPLALPLVRALAALRVPADLMTLAGIAAYVIGALLFLRGGTAALFWGALAFWAGLVAELLDGGLARLRGPSAIGYGLSKWMEQTFRILLAPSLALGLLAAGEVSVWLAAAAVVGASMHVAFTAGVEAVRSAHPDEELAALADRTDDRRRLWALAQFLPRHPRLTRGMRASRIVRENLMESSGILPVVFLATVLGGRPEWFLAYYAAVQVPAYLGFVALRLALLRRGGGRILATPEEER